MGRVRYPPPGAHATPGGMRVAGVGTRPACDSDTSCPARSTGPPSCVAQAVAAERPGFEGLWISDHFHPWNDEQGQSPFVWSVIGALSRPARCR